MTQLSLRRLKALLVKESYQIQRDISSVLIAFVVPLILIFLYGSGVSLDLKHLPLGIVLDDLSPAARSFADALNSSEYFNTHYAETQKQLEEQLIAGNLRAMVVIPFYFTERLRNDPLIAPIQVITDGSEPNIAALAQNYIQAAWNGWRSILRAEGETVSQIPIAVQARVWFNEELNSRYFLLPGSMGIIMAMIGTLLTALVVAREWERGTMEALLATPVSMLEMLIGKLLPYFFLGLGSMAICLFCATVIYGVPFRGSFLALVFTTSAFLFASLGMGLFISSTSRNQFVAAQASIIVAFIPALILSGFIFEISSMPPAIQMITYILPARYFVTSIKTLFLAGDIWPLLLPNAAAIVAIGLFFFSITLLKTRKRLD